MHHGKKFQLFVSIRCGSLEACCLQYLGKQRDLVYLWVVEPDLLDLETGGIVKGTELKETPGNNLPIFPHSSTDKKARLEKFIYSLKLPTVPTYLCTVSGVFLPKPTTPISK